MLKHAPVLLLCFTLCGCAAFNSMLQGADPQALKALAPNVQTRNFGVRRIPSLQKLGAYYCPVVLENPIAQLGCAAALGPRPLPQEISIEFGITLVAKNPNNVPIPALDALVALTMFPGQDQEALGATCVSLCGQQDPTCNGTPRAGACTSSQNDIRRIEDFAARVPGLIAGLATGQVQSELRKSRIAAGGDIQVDLSYALGIEQALRLLQKAVSRVVPDLVSGRSAVVEVPVSVQGTFFFELPAVGRVGVGYGPIASSWQLR